MKLINEIPSELLDAVNKFSKELEWCRRLPIYEVHKWWARRYSGIIRLFLAFAVLDKKVLEKVDDFHVFVKNLYFHPPKVRDKKLLDPFCGGGTIIIEGAKLGYDAYGIEINKLAYLMLRTLKALPKLDFNFIKNKIIQISMDLKNIWSTKCIKGHDAWIIHTFLAWKDENGQLQIKFNKLKDGKIKFYFCEKCWKIYTDSKEIKICKICKNKFNKKHAQIKYVSIEPYAIEYFCPFCNQRGFKILSLEDLQKFYLKTRWNSFEIPELNETKRLLKNGFKYFDQLLSPRQQLTFQKFLNSFKIEPYKTIAKLLISDSLRSCSLLAYYSAKYRKVIPGFVIKSYWLPPQPVELNPLSFIFSKTGELLPIGRGNIISAFRKLIRAKKFIEHQKIPLKYNIYHGPAQDVLPNLKETFDIVFTDPPYGNYQFYSDLSLFSLSIIREINNSSLNELLEKEVVLRSKKDLTKYKRNLYLVFSLVKNKLSKDGKIIITYHHSDKKLLLEILDIFKNLSLNLQAIYPVIGESSGKLAKRRLYLDLIFIFGNEKLGPYYTFTTYSFTKYDEELQNSIEDFIQFYKG